MTHLCKQCPQNLCNECASKNGLKCLKCKAELKKNKQLNQKFCNLKCKCKICDQVLLISDKDAHPQTKGEHISKCICGKIEKLDLIQIHKTECLIHLKNKIMKQKEKIKNLESEKTKVENKNWILELDLKKCKAESEEKSLVIEQKSKKLDNVFEYLNKNNKQQLLTFQSISNNFKPFQCFVESYDIQIKRLKKKIKEENGFTTLFDLCYKNDMLDEKYNLSKYLDNSSSPLIIKFKEIQVKSINGKTRMIPYDSHTTILQAKEYIQEHDGITINDQRLIYSGKQLEDDKTFGDYDIPEESIIHLVLKIRGD